MANKLPDVLNLQARIGSIEADRGKVVRLHPLGKRLSILGSRRGRRVNGEFEYQVEGWPELLCKILRILLERTVIDGKEADLVVRELYEVGEMHGANLIPPSFR